MHPYGIDTNERRWVFIILVPISFWLSWTLLKLVSMLPFAIPSNLDWIFDPGSAAACFLGLTWLMDNFGWKWNWFRKSGIVKTPDLNGVWEGAILSSYFNFDPEKKIAFTARIKQDWTRCQVQIEVPRSSGSTSQSASMFLDRIHPRIIYTYVNNPDPSNVATMETHFGTAELDYFETGTVARLKGRYYNGRGRGTLGEMEMVRKKV